SSSKLFFKIGNLSLIIGTRPAARCFLPAVLHYFTVSGFLRALRFALDLPASLPVRELTCRLTAKKGGTNVYRCLYENRSDGHCRCTCGHRLSGAGNRVGGQGCLLRDCGMWSSRSAALHCADQAATMM